MNDVFSDIATKGIGGRAELLTQNKPPKIEKKISRLTESKSAAIETKEKISTKEELSKELANMREKYKKYLKDFAPSFESVNSRIYLEEFNRDGSKVKIPDYGGPIGYAKKTYETEFVLDSKNPEKAYYICFKGADYIAYVYINDVCVGSHEGFFSPFEFNIDNSIVEGTNKLKIDLYNDYPYGWGADGDKLYAATGLGWDDPQEGWHHCPPGMGIYDSVYVEERNRLSIHNIFVRENEVWVEVLNDDYIAKNVEFNISIYGQNFRETVIENFRYTPSTMQTVGLGDSLGEAVYGDTLGKGIPIPAKKGINVYKIPFKIEKPKIWTPDEPNLYQIHIEISENSIVTDKKARQFGIRTFTQDVESSPKGMFYLNNEKIRLRGANTMGFEQQDVLRGDTEQLIDDILLAKLCNMNFFRLTQRPVQDKVYEYCDKLGFLTQTDLPLFGCMRRTKLAEGIRQAEEMEKIVRNHPCNILVTYINEPFPNAYNMPHRFFERAELERFFDCCDIAVHLHNPDRVIRHVDGDYDPPSKTMPDNHCYPMWYNAHGIDIGLLNKGYWIHTRPDWYYGCGEFGAEGLDFYDVMKNDYPSEWMKEPFHPNNIIGAQTGRFYHFFFDKGDNAEDWIKKSQAHQAFATKIMTEAFRRNSDMISQAIHLYIDAWPAGWMKTIMDCKRNPKPAYFAYRNALEPVMLSLRTDRYTYFEGETVSIECFVCNDTNKSGDYKVVYEMNKLSAEENVFVKACDTVYVSNAEFVIDKVNIREKFFVKAILLNDKDEVITYNTAEIEVFEKQAEVNNTENEIIYNLLPGEYEIAGETVKVKPCGMLPVHFVSRKTNHKAVERFYEKDFSYWYDKETDMIKPILYNTFEAEGFTPILISGNKNEKGEWSEVLACAEKIYNGKRYIICNVDLRTENPIAYMFKNELMKL